MRYTVQLEIDQPLEKVIELFDNPKNLSQWMEGLQSFEHLSGTPGEPGAKSRLKFKMGKREFDMIETVTVRNLPHEFSGTYETQGMTSEVHNKFKKLSENKTLHISENIFEMKGFMKVFGLLMPGMFKKQSMKYLEAFKKFAESTAL